VLFPSFDVDFDFVLDLSILVSLCSSPPEAFIFLSCAGTVLDHRFPSSSKMQCTWDSSLGFHSWGALSAVTDANKFVLRALIDLSF
jgi:hypothetical protein